MSEYNLKGKMKEWGPFEEKEGQWAIFSVGNPDEGHGLALPRIIDDLHAKKVAHEVEFKTGQRYVAHIPYTTDRCGPVARDWSPSYIPMEEFKLKSVEFMRNYLTILEERGIGVSKVMLLNGHGGNEDFHKYKDEIERELNLEEFVSESAFISIDSIRVILKELKILAKEQIETKGMVFGFDDSKELANYYTKLLMTVAHASHVEHSLAAALGVCDMNKVDIMNSFLGKDFEGALKKWPPIGGLGGYLLAGGKYTEALGTEDDDKFGLFNCLKGLRDINNGKLVVIPELGHLIYRISIDMKSKKLLS